MKKLKKKKLEKFKKFELSKKQTSKLKGGSGEGNDESNIVTEEVTDT